MHERLRCQAPEAFVSNRAGDGVRTHDIQLGKLALYQLSYARRTEGKVPRRAGIRQYPAGQGAGVTTNSTGAQASPRGAWASRGRGTATPSPTRSWRVIRGTTR